MLSPLRQGLYSHFSPEQLAKLGKARVGLAGAGGLGSNVAMLLLRSGIRCFVVADHDTVEESNLNRQFYWPEDIGKPKVQALEERLRSLEPDIEYAGYRLCLDAGTAPALFKNCDVLVEALDDAQLKAALCSACVGEGMYVVSASGMGGYGFSPMGLKRLGKSFVCVGDFTREADAASPPLAPRVMQAAALQADAVLAKILE